MLAAGFRVRVRRTREAGGEEKDSVPIGAGVEPSGHRELSFRTRLRAGRDHPEAALIGLGDTDVRRLRLEMRRQPCGGHPETFGQRQILAGERLLQCPPGTEFDRVGVAPQTLITRSRMAEI
jgi:hypothetical protein